MHKTLHHFLYQKVSITPLVVFRIIFGAMLFFSTARFMYLGWIEDHYLQPKLHFKYFGFEWIEVASPTVMYGLHYLLLAASLGILLGFLYRIATILAFFIFTYTELIDITYYLNHYYFVSLVCFLLMFIPAHHAFSIDAFWKKDEQKTVANWCIFILKFQIFIVYCFAGLAKMNATWLLEAQPLRIWLPANDTLPLIGAWLKMPITAYIFSWAGMLFDTFIIFFLAHKKTRIFAYITIIIFHTITGLMFQIGVFPLVMMGATLIFFDWNVIIPYKVTDTSEVSVTSAYKNITTSLLIFYILFQILFPWRFLCYKGDMFWTEQGYRFGWRVMLMEKAGTATFYVKNQLTGREGMVYNEDFLNPHQEKQMAMQPDLILQYAHFLKKYYESKGMQNVSVRAEVYVTLNGKPSRLYFNPQLDLTTLKDNWQEKTWLY
jgi:Vitamin K-dependent gamma-carboxylase